MRRIVKVRLVVVVVTVGGAVFVLVIGMVVLVFVAMGMVVFVIVVVTVLVLAIVRMTVLGRVRMFVLMPVRITVLVAMILVVIVRVLAFVLVFVFVRHFPVFLFFESYSLFYLLPFKVIPDYSLRSSRLDCLHSTRDSLNQYSETERSSDKNVSERVGPRITFQLAVHGCEKINLFRYHPSLAQILGRAIPALDFSGDRAQLD